MSLSRYMCSYLLCVLADGCSNYLRMVVIMKINHEKLKLAQRKARLARLLGDGLKWMEANEEMKRAAGMPWYRGRMEG